LIDFLSKNVLDLNFGGVGIDEAADPWCGVS